MEAYRDESKAMLARAMRSAVESRKNGANYAPSDDRSAFASCPQEFKAFDIRSSVLMDKKRKD